MTTARHLPDLPRRWYAAYAIGLFTTLIGVTALIVPGDARAAGTALAPAARTTELVGTLQLTAGSCPGGKARGTYLRMILPSGGASGPYMANNDSTCSDQSYTPLSPGQDGGLRVGSYQPTPTPRFGPDGDAKANRITAPAPFYGTSFATATNQVDPQTKKAVPAPRATVNGSTLSVDLRSFAVTWNNQDFNQGAPKPDGSTPGNTRRATGTYNASTGAFTLNWSSQVQGGPFDKFTGSWHFEGRFVPATGSSAPAPQPGTGAAPGTGTTTPGTTGGTTTPGGTAGVANPGTVAPGTAPGAAPVLTGDVPAAAPATTTTVTTDKWRVSWPVLLLAIAIAVLGFGALLGLNRLTRKPVEAS